jgi:hypothetical protein
MHSSARLACVLLATCALSLPYVLHGRHGLVYQHGYACANTKEQSMFREAWNHARVQMYHLQSMQSLRGEKHVQAPLSHFCDFFTIPA